MSEWNYIIAAYALTWIAIVGYAVHLARRLRRAANDLDRTGPAGNAIDETETRA